MADVVPWLRGKKTYLCAGAGGVVIVLYFVGAMEKATADALLAACGFGSLAALRASLAARIEARRAASPPPAPPASPFLVDETGKPVR
jgi:hypothetical protein